jgi:asparagine synthase (glutamine-hydrolysing)
MQTYLPGLFQQDDRMSMANGLESRVPLADPRIVRFACHTSFDLKVRSGATKWILREAVAEMIPADVLNRRKVGFDTPAESWMRGSQSGFVRELLLSSRARTRGLWNPHAIEQLLDDRSPMWFQTIWKVLSIEAWAVVFLDRAAATVATREPCEPYTVARS